VLIRRSPSVHTTLSALVDRRHLSPGVRDDCHVVALDCRSDDFNVGEIWLADVDPVKFTGAACSLSDY